MSTTKEERMDDETFAMRSVGILHECVVRHGREEYVVEARRARAAEATLTARVDELTRDALTCRFCQKPATCVGDYEGQRDPGPACDNCCGHGNEDGRCIEVARANEWMALISGVTADLRDERDELTRERDAARGVSFDADCDRECALIQQKGGMRMLRHSRFCRAALRPAPLADATKPAPKCSAHECQNTARYGFDGVASLCWQHAGDLPEVAPRPGDEGGGGR